MGTRKAGVKPDDGASPKVAAEGVFGSADIMVSRAESELSVTRHASNSACHSMATASFVAEHILQHLARSTRSKSQAPLFIALQGPQGSGKTHLTRTLVTTLSSPPHDLHVAVLSVDDLYLTHEGLVNLSRNHSTNKLWNGRGQPGTHDVALGAEVLRRLYSINSDGTGGVTLPSFDKSKFSGEGDRASEGTTVHAPLDVVLFEGWCVGFYPLAPEELETKWESVIVETRYAPESIVARAMHGVQKEDIVATNEALRGYVRQWYQRFELFVQIRPPANTPYDYIYTWRLQQEHSMKASNGGAGMTDEQVVKFVDRYIPGYVFFGDGVRHGGKVEGRPPWEGNGLAITIDEQRQVIATENF